MSFRHTKAAYAALVLGLALSAPFPALQAAGPGPAAGQPTAFCNDFREGLSSRPGMVAGSRVETVRAGKSTTYEFQTMGLANGSIRYYVDGPRQTGDDSVVCEPIALYYVSTLERLEDDQFEITLVNGRVYRVPARFSFMTIDGRVRGKVVHRPASGDERPLYVWVDNGTGGLGVEVLDPGAVVRMTFAGAVASAVGSTEPKLVRDLLRLCDPTTGNIDACRAFIGPRIAAVEADTLSRYLYDQRMTECLRQLYDNTPERKRIDFVASKVAEFEQAVGEILNAKTFGADAPAGAAVEATPESICMWDTAGRAALEMMRELQN